MRCAPAVLLALVGGLGACDDDARALPRADGGFDRGDGAGRYPPWDAAPDVPPPDAALVGPPMVTIEPRAFTVVEGRPARVATILLHGELETPVTVRVTTSAGVVEPAELRFEPGGDRAATVRLSAPFDDDERNDHGTLSASFGGGDADAPVVVVDVHNTIELAFDEEQLAFVASSRDKERRLVVGTRIAGRPAPSAELNLRGKGTLDCERRSFTVRFDQPAYIRDSPALEHVVLLSMCLDSTYLKMRSSAEVLQGFGLFPPWFTFAELRYGGRSRGVYMVVERPRKAIPRVFPENEVVVRRIRDNIEEVKRPAAETIEDLDAFLAPYRRLFELRRAFVAEALLDALRSHMDYDNYLRWLAVNSVLRNGDYIDEVYFYDRRAPAGATSPYFAVMGWDYDDILRGCHTRGPLPEPLFYCAESSLDRPVMDHPAVRQVYVEILRSVMTEALSVEAYGALLRRVAGELAVYLRREGVADAMRVDREDMSPPPEPEAAAAEMLELMSARHAELEGLLP